MKYQRYVCEYICERRGFGYALVCEERYLKNFARFVDQRNCEFLTVSDFLDWKQSYGSAGARTWSRRLSTYRTFTQWLLHFESQTEIPPAQLFPRTTFTKMQAYIYKDKEILDLLCEAGKLRSKLGLKRIAYPTLFGLYSVTGLRINEGLNLTVSDIDFENQTLLIRNSKTNKERIVPIASSTAKELKTYHDEATRLTSRTNPKFFIVEDDRPINEFSARYNFAQISQRIGLRKNQKFGRYGRGPRIHDFRHTFAVKTIINAINDNLNLDDEIHKLSLFLGHSTLQGTYWYIHSVPELMHLVSEKVKCIALPTK